MSDRDEFRLMEDAPGALPAPIQGVSEMVERVAAALFEDWAADPFSELSIRTLYGARGVTWAKATSATFVQIVPDSFRAKARKAIGAMAEPTEAILEAGCNEPVSHSWGSGGEFITDPDQIWRAMIAAALR